jgi:fibronectin type 3 domain-containing protein
VTNNQYRQVNLQWQPNPENDISAYEIFRGETGDDLRRVATVKTPATSYADSGLRDGSIYWYQVRAIDNDQLQGTLISPDTAATKPRPAAPTGLTAHHKAQGIMLQWHDNPEKDIDHFEIYTLGFLTTKIGETSATTFLYSGKLDPDSEYRFQVRAVDSDGLTGGYSQPVLIRVPMPLTTGNN